MFGRARAFLRASIGCATDAVRVEVVDSPPALATVRFKIVSCACGVLTLFSGTTSLAACGRCGGEVSQAESIGGSAGSGTPVSSLLGEGDLFVTMVEAFF